MSLGALDFGIIIDGAVVIVENCVRRLAHAQAHHGRPLTRAERFHEECFWPPRSRAAIAVRTAHHHGGVPAHLRADGRGREDVPPMAFTVVAALLGAMVLSVTFVPAAVALFIGNRVSEKERFLLGHAKRLVWSTARPCHGRQGGRTDHSCSCGDGLVRVDRHAHGQRVCSQSQ